MALIGESLHAATAEVANIGTYVPPVSGTPVANAAALASALSSASAGDTIILSDGFSATGDTDLTRVNAGSKITIAAESYLGASFANLYFDDSSGIHLTGVECATLYTEGSGQDGMEFSHIQTGYFKVVGVSGDLAVNWHAHDMLIDGGGTSNGGNFNLASNFTMENIMVFDVGIDGLQFQGVHTGTLRRIGIRDISIPSGSSLHGDCIQIRSYDGVDPHDMLIERCMMSDAAVGSEKGAQGLFLGTGCTYDNTIRECIAKGRLSRDISAAATTGLVIEKSIAMDTLIYNASSSTGGQIVGNLSGSLTADGSVAATVANNSTATGAVLDWDNGDDDWRNLKATPAGALDNENGWYAQDFISTLEAEAAAREGGTPTLSAPIIGGGLFLAGGV